MGADDVLGNNRECLGRFVAGGILAHDPGALELEREGILKGL